MTKPMTMADAVEIAFIAASAADLHQAPAKWADIGAASKSRWTQIAAYGQQVLWDLQDVDDLMQANDASLIPYAERAVIDRVLFENFLRTMKSLEPFVADHPSTVPPPQGDPLAELLNSERQGEDAGLMPDGLQWRAILHDQPAPNRPMVECVAILNGHASVQLIDPVSFGFVAGTSLLKYSQITSALIGCVQRARAAAKGTA